MIITVTFPQERSLPEIGGCHHRVDDDDPVGDLRQRPVVGDDEGGPVSRRGLDGAMTPAAATGSSDAVGSSSSTTETGNWLFVLVLRWQIHSFRQPAIVNGK